ncbi:MAG: RNA polymerase sigma-70 factor (ECF subfamily) [Marinoscillum sp.]|jgi:RNA polymerase sigma-70 factor (ECF subfamily)
MEELTDEELFLEVKTGNVKSFEIIFKRHYADITRFATSIVRDAVIGEEIAQEVFMYIWEKRAKIELHTGLRAYLFSSAKNKCLNYIKLELPKQQALTDLSNVASHLSDGMTTNDTELLKRKIQHAIDQLPEKCRNIFVLSRYGGLTYQEIAEDLELSPKTIENQMSIALKKLKESLSDELKNFRL